jgi:hypothetical protein
MEQLISQINILLMVIKQIPLEYYAMANNLLTSNTKVIDLGISPWATITTWNNYENLEDGSSGMKHPKKCS